MRKMESRRGVIYVLANAYMPGILKIGRTVRDVKSRVHELSRASGVPVQFEVIYDEVVSDVVLAEQRIHAELSAWRVNNAREFFRIGIRDAIEVVQSISRQFAIDEEAEAGEIEILPRLENRMRRWLRREIVSVKFVQFPDLCLLRITEQPDPAKIDAYQTAIDLAVFAGEDTDDEMLFSPSERTIQENVDEFLKLDPYSMVMVDLKLLNDEAGDYVAYLVEQLHTDPPIKLDWRVSSIKYDLMGCDKFGEDRDNESIIAWLQEHDSRRLGDRKT